MKNVTLLCIFYFNFFFREDLLKVLLPIRSVFPSLLKCLFRQPSPVPDPDPVQEEQDSTHSPKSEAGSTSSNNNHSSSNENLNLTFCPLCRQPSYELVGQTLESLEAQESS